MSVAIISIRFALLYVLLITFQKKLSGQEKFCANQKKIISGIIQEERVDSSQLKIQQVSSSRTEVRRCR